MEPIVSVVIPHFNRSELLSETIASALASTEERLEIIVVDDGSSDSEWARVKQERRDNVRVLRRDQGPKGPSRCRNFGIEASRAEYIVFIDSDDLMAPWCLENRLRAVTRDPGADLWVFPVMLFEALPGDLDTMWNELETGDPCAIRFARGDSPWHTSSPLWKKSSLRKVSGFNERVIYGDDSDLHLRALLSGLVVKIENATLPDVFVRRSDAPRITNSLTASLVESRRMRLSEGTKFLKTRKSAADVLSAWQAQYFVEAEFLLFNHVDAALAVMAVVDDWEAEFAPTAAARRIVRTYFGIALRTRARAYLVLRIARRAAMLLLPAEFFARGGGFHRAKASAGTMAALRARFPS